MITDGNAYAEPSSRAALDFTNHMPATLELSGRTEILVILVSTTLEKIASLEGNNGNSLRTIVRQDLGCRRTERFS